MAVEIIRMIIITMQWGAPVPTAFEIIRIIINIMKLRSTCTHGNWDNQNYHHHNEIKKHLNPRPPMILPLSQSSSASQEHDSLPHLFIISIMSFIILFDYLFYKRPGSMVPNLWMLPISRTSSVSSVPIWVLISVPVVIPVPVMVRFCEVVV